MPKGGRTWLRFILANYFNLLFDLKIKIDMKTMFSVIPNDGVSPLKGKGAYKYIKDNRFPLVIMSHKNLNNITAQGQNIIILLRLVYDVMVSDYFQHKYFLKRFNGEISEFIRVKEGALYQYCNFINSLKDNEDSILFLTYESIHKNIESSVLSLLHYLNVPRDDEILKKSITLSSFNNMKTIENDNGFIGKDNKGNNPNSFRVREGKTNNYKKYLNDEDIQFIGYFCDQNLNESGKNMLKKLNISYCKTGK